MTGRNSGGCGTTRRDWLRGAGASLVVPATAWAQQPAGRRPRLGYLSLSPRNAGVARLFEQLARAGLVEGDTLEVIDASGTTLQALPATVARIVAASPDAIFAGGDVVGQSFRRATTTIPIVNISDDLLGAGLVLSLARPGTNVTGVSIFANELNGKRQDILLDLVPGATRIVALHDPATAPTAHVEALRAAAQARGAALQPLLVTRESEIGPALEAAKAAGAQAVNVLASALFHAGHAALIAGAARLRLPAIYQWPEYVESGGLVGYGPRLDYILGRLIARQLIRVLRGARPADLPVEQPTEFELGINLRAAAELGLAVPESFLARVDQVVR